MKLEGSSARSEEERSYWGIEDRDAVRLGLREGKSGWTGMCGVRAGSPLWPHFRFPDTGGKKHCWFFQRSGANAKVGQVEG